MTSHFKKEIEEELEIKEKIIKLIKKIISQNLEIININSKYKKYYPEFYNQSTQESKESIKKFTSLLKKRQDEYNSITSF